MQGAERYRVRLELAGGELERSCTCPVGREGLFCKHCVAVGLAWLEREHHLREPGAAPTRSELRDRLVALGAEIVAFCEHALRRVEAACEYVDDSGGELGSVREWLEDLHLAACREARPEPRELAERLFRGEVEGEWDTFFGAV